MILKLLAEKAPLCVFKGGTSLSKGFNVINRFSEDIDITFSEHIGEARRKKLKYNVIGEISKELKIPISNFEKSESDKDYNYYIFEYASIFNIREDGLSNGVKLETALASYAFPTEVVKIDNYLRKYLSVDNMKLIDEYNLDIFEMSLQSIARTYIDKVFALCDYYMQGKSKRYSRHLYDVYKLSNHIEINDEFIELINEVRDQRSKLSICPSAQKDINISQMICDFCDNDYYKEDYNLITNYFIEDTVEYDDVKKYMYSLVKMRIFD